MLKLNMSRLNVTSVAVGLFFATAAPAFADEVNIYSYREPSLIEPLLQAFEAKSGHKVNLVFAKEGLIERAAAEAANSPADVLLTNEFGLLLQAKSAGITGKIGSARLASDIPAAYRDPEDEWVGLTRRARVVYASRERVADTSIRYEDLADPKWRGRICMRSGQHTYNIGLVASMIANLGPDKAEDWLKGLKANLARKPAGGDRDQVKGVFSGECDLAIGNTYYMGQMMTNEAEPEQKQWAASVKMLFPNADDRGTHVNISGAVLLKHAPHRAAAVELLEFLASEEGQKLYTERNNEYPVREGVAESSMVEGWGDLKADPLPLAEMAKHRKDASEMVDRVGFDQGPGA